MTLAASFQVPIGMKMPHAKRPWPAAEGKATSFKRRSRDQEALPGEMTDDRIVLKSPKKAISVNAVCGRRVFWTGVLVELQLISSQNRPCIKLGGFRNGGGPVPRDGT